MFMQKYHTMLSSCFLVLDIPFYGCLAGGRHHDIETAAKFTDIAKTIIDIAKVENEFVKFKGA